MSLTTGMSQTAPSDIHFSQPGLGTDATIVDVPWRGHPFQGSRYYNYRIGVSGLFRQHHIALFADMLHYKAYARVEKSRPIIGTWDGVPVNETTPIDDRVQEFRITNGVNVISLTVQYRWAVQRSHQYPLGRFQPYIGGGPSYYILYPINIVDHQGYNHHGYEDSGWGYMFQAGIRYNLFRHTAFLFETRFTRGDADVTIDQGQAETDLRTMHGLAGLSFDF